MHTLALNQTCTHIYMCTHGPSFLEARFGAEVTQELQGLGDYGMIIIEVAYRYWLLKCSTTEGYRAWALLLMRCET